MVEPSLMLPQVLIMEPNLTYFRNDIDEPMWKWSRIERVEPSCWYPYTLILEPTREKPLKLYDDPIVM
jgi:hypothetical protein